MSSKIERFIQTIKVYIHVTIKTWCYNVDMYSKSFDPTLLEKK